MKHATTRALHAHWDGLRGARAAPDRGEIEPGEIRHLLADSFILELDVPNRDARFRLAGTRLCALFGRELRGAPLDSLWGGERGEGRGWRFVDLVLAETRGVVVGIVGRSDHGEAIDLELVLLPLRHGGRTHARMLGALSATAAPLWLGFHRLVHLDTVSLRVLDAAVGEADEAWEAAGAPAETSAGEGALGAPARRHAFVVLPGGLR